jgi:hypothetical protein
MAVQLVINTPDVASLTAATRTRYVMPAGGAATWVRIYSASDCYLELADVGDATSQGTDFETVKGGQATTRQIRRGEFALSGSTSQDVEVTAATRPGPG